MTSISFSKDLELHFLGRNGLGRICGAEILPIAGQAALHIEPVTSKGVAGRCSIEIPVNHLHQFVSALQAAAEEIQPAKTQNEGAAVDRLVFEFGHWGEHPRFARSDWKYEVANGDTQRGYWEFVAAKLEEEDSESVAQPERTFTL